MYLIVRIEDDRLNIFIFILFSILFYFLDLGLRVSIILSQNELLTGCDT